MRHLRSQFVESPLARQLLIKAGGPTSRCHCFFRLYFPLQWAKLQWMCSANMASKLLVALLLLYFQYTTYAEASSESSTSHKLLGARSQSRAWARPHDKRSTGCFYLDGGRSGDHFFQWVKLKISGWECKEKLRETVKVFCDSDTEKVELVSQLHGEPGLSYDPGTDICTLIFIFTSQMPLVSMNDSPLKGPECGRMALWCSNPQKPMADHCVSVLHSRTSLLFRGD